MQQIAELLQWGDPGHQPAAMMGQFRRERRGLQLCLCLCLRGVRVCVRGWRAMRKEEFVMPSTLNLSREDMRALGYRVIDMLVEHFQELPEKPVTRKADRPTLEARLREAIPEHGANVLEVLGRLQRDVFSNIMHTDHPRFFAFVPSPSNFVSVMADALASGFNVFAATWLEASGPTQIELVTIDWLRQACGLPDSAGGLFVSGGSMANMTALAVARHVQLGNRTEGAVIYCSDQTHSSVERGLRVLGFQDSQMCKIRSAADRFRLDVSALRRAIEADRAAGRVPFCVVANAGMTNTGAIDPLMALADYCRQEELWLHVDGAYGAAAVFCERGQALLDGLACVDSLSLDPHKWLFQPYEIGCVLVREERWLRDAFHILPEYLEDNEAFAHVPFESSCPSSIRDIRVQRIGGDKWPS